MRLFAGIILYLLGSMSMLLVDVIGHINAAKQNSSSAVEESLCMFHYSSTTSRHLEMHWSDNYGTSQCPTGGRSTHSNDYSS